jgi:hypothetical protein
LLQNQKKGMKPLQINIYKDKMLGARLFGAPVLYSAQPLPREDVPQGWCCYDLRGTARRPDEPHALVNLYMAGAKRSCTSVLCKKYRLSDRAVQKRKAAFEKFVLGLLKK